MNKRLRLVLLIVVTNASLFLPTILLPSSRFDTAGGLFSLGALAVVVVSYARGITAGIWASALLGLASAIAIASTAILIVAIAVMIMVALAQGVAARHGVNRVTVLIPITLSFVISEPPTEGPLANSVAFGLSLAVFGAIVAISVAAINRGAPRRPRPNGISASRATAYAFLLAGTSVATTWVAESNDWGHAGGWLIMTPFIVIQPYVQDGWRKALARAAGTVVGFAIASGLADIVGSPALLTAFGFAFATLALVAMIRKWRYSLYATLLTPAIVLLESGGRSVARLADNRLEATLLGVGLSMIAMAIAVPIYRRQARRLGLDKY